jgi:pyruvate dehydrogenase E2 component (dihydrolipoamide acetyltransferase)
MITNLFIPKLGMTMESATIAEWCFNDGDNVGKDSVILVIDTEKTANDIEAPASGKLVITANVGDELPCGDVIGYIAETQAEYDSLKAGASTDSVAPAASSQPEESQPAPEVTQPATPVPQDTTEPQRRIKISPVAKKIARQNNLDYSNISGTGPGGRIVKEDVVMAIEAGPSAAKPSSVSSQSSPQREGKRVKQVLSLSGARKVISDRMHQSLAVSAPVSIFTEVDMTEMIAARKRLKEEGEAQGLKITYTDLFIMAVARALRSVPLMNSSLVGDEILVWDEINIGFAVSIVIAEGENSLVVPVIRNADKLSLGEISRTRSDLMEKARNGKLGSKEMSGGTFTLTNTGTLLPMWHIQTPIINQPQAAILGTSGIVDRPVVVAGELAVRPVMPMSLTFDHRIMDGEPSGIFINKVHQMILDPNLLLL